MYRVLVLYGLKSELEVGDFAEEGVALAGPALLFAEPALLFTEPALFLAEPSDLFAVGIGGARGVANVGFEEGAWG